MRTPSNIPKYPDYHLRSHICIMHLENNKSSFKLNNVLGPWQTAIDYLSTLGSGPTRTPQ